MWRALDPTVKVSAGDAMTFKQEQQKVSSAFWVAFSARPVETEGQRQGDLLGRCDRSPGRDGRTSFRATFVPGEGCLDQQQIYLCIKMVYVEAGGAQVRLGEAAWTPVRGSPPAGSAAAPGV